MGKYYKIALRVLKETGKFMTGREIWDYAVSHNYDVSFVDTQTPWSSISSHLSTNIKNGKVHNVKRIDNPVRFKYVGNKSVEVYDDGRIYTQYRNGKFVLLTGSMVINDLHSADAKLKKKLLLKGDVIRTNNRLIMAIDYPFDTLDEYNAFVFGINNPTKNDEVIRFHDMNITLVVGDSGSGKTFFSLLHPNRNRGIYIDLQNRYGTTLASYPSINVKKGLNFKNRGLELFSYYEGIETKDGYEVDKISSFNTAISLINKAMQVNGVKLIVIDSINDLRRMAREKYETEHNKNISTPYDKYTIDSMVKDILSKLFNFARRKKVQIILTTNFIHTYVNGNITTQQIIDAPDYVLTQVDGILKLYRQNTSYFIECDKSPNGATEKMEWTVK